MRFVRSFVTVAVAILALMGCQHRWEPDPDLGKSVRGLAAAQYLNPNAPHGVRAPVGMDGPAAQSTIETYRESFKAPSTDAIDTTMTDTTQ